LAADESASSFRLAAEDLDAFGAARTPIAVFVKRSGDIQFSKPRSGVSLCIARSTHRDECLRCGIRYRKVDTGSAPFEQAC